MNVKYISAKDAAGWFGVTDVAVYRVLDKAGIRNHTIDPSGNKSFLLEEVADEAGRRAGEAFRRSGKQTLEEWATEIRDTLRPPPVETLTLSTGERIPRDASAVARDLKTPKGAAALVYLDRAAVDVFGRHVLNAAVSDAKCRWHEANSFRPMGAMPLKISKPLEILLGSPCAACKIDGTPPPKPLTAASRARTASATQALSGVTLWLQRARDAAARGDFKRARAYRKNAESWAQYGRSGS